MGQKSYLELGWELEVHPTCKVVLLREIYKMYPYSIAEKCFLSKLCMFEVFLIFSFGENLHMRRVRGLGSKLDVLNSKFLVWKGNGMLWWGKASGLVNFRFLLYLCWFWSVSV
jgi:hypothetical protein